jgi:uncharacterized repeat protein (TIGR04076 family)
MTYYKVIATVHKVSPPSSQTPNQPVHVVMPCRMYTKGDRIVFEDNQINMIETTGALCLSLVASMIPVLKAMQRSVKPLLDEKRDVERHDSTQQVAWFSCPDAERPVIFKIERVPQNVPGWIVAEELALKNPGKRIHLHTPNPTDKHRGDQENLWEKYML